MHCIGSDEELSHNGDSTPVLGSTWEAIGPFPSGMREHTLMATPLHAYSTVSSHTHPDVDLALRPYDLNDTWPSELSTGGKVGWSKFSMGDDGWVEIFYPDIKWDQLRSDHGWAALQYQTILRTNLSAPSIPDQHSTPIRIDLIQGTEFALIPRSHPPQLPLQWYAGDVYDFSDSPAGRRDTTSESQLSNFARSLSVTPGEYVVLVRAMYEVRMFGDPGVGKSPVIKMNFAVEVDGGDDMKIVGGLRIVPDIVDGWFMGVWTSMGVRVKRGAEEGRVIGVESGFKDVELELQGEVNIVAGQTRPVAIRIKQRNALDKKAVHLEVLLLVEQSGRQRRITAQIPLQHIDKSSNKPFQITFPSPEPPRGSIPSQISYAVVVPPINLSSSKKPPVILALHGAGVDASSPFWSDAIPRRDGGWAVLPTGKNEWGEDWHGGSMEDCWAAREAFQRLVRKIGVETSDETLLIGHSNGGQGAWHLAARHPDRIGGVIGAAGYMKIQDYVPYTELVSHHYADPLLMGIIQSALTPYNNDLHLTNLSNTPALAIHGSVDGNVTPRHSRSYMSIIRSFTGDQDSTLAEMIEVEGKDHWWDEVFRVEGVDDFIKGIPEKDWEADTKKGFTLSCANPDECGGRAGIRILELVTPGRLARLDVNAKQWRNSPDWGSGPHGLDIRGMNVKRIQLDGMTPRGDSEIYELGLTSRSWLKTPDDRPEVHDIRAYGPMIRILATRAAINIVIGSVQQHRDLAKRIAHDLYVYHRIDSEILPGEQALERYRKRELGVGNIVVIGRPEENRFGQWMAQERRIPITFPGKRLISVNDKVVYEQGSGIITLHPHPVDNKALSCWIAGNDAEGLETAARLFPIRTGVPIPDWAVVGSRMTWQGAGGLIGAGFWDGDWGWSEGMSWVDR